MIVFIIFPSIWPEVIAVQKLFAAFLYDTLNTFQYSPFVFISKVFKFRRAVFSEVNNLFQSCAIVGKWQLSECGRNKLNKTRRGPGSAIIFNLFRQSRRCRWAGVDYTAVGVMIVCSMFPCFHTKRSVKETLISFSWTA